MKKSKVLFASGVTLLLAVHLFANISIRDNFPYPDPVPVKPECKKVSVSDPIHFNRVALSYNSSDLTPTAYQEILHAHSGSPISTVHFLITPVTHALPDEDRSYLTISVTSSECYGPLNTSLDDPALTAPIRAQVLESMGASTLEVTANSIRSRKGGNQRLVWTQSYSAPQLWNMDFEAQATVVSTRSVTQYHAMPDSASLGDSWFVNPVYYRGMEIPNPPIIDPTPSDSIFL